MNQLFGGEGVLRVPVVGVLDHAQAHAGGPVGQAVGAGVDHLVRGRTHGLAVLGQHVLAQRAEHPVAQIGDEVVVGSFQRELKRLVVQRLHADLIEVGDLAVVEGRAVDQTHGGVEGAAGRAVGRIQIGLHHEHEVLGPDLHAVGILRVADLEGVDQTVVGNRVVLAQLVLDLAVLIAE